MIAQQVIAQIQSSPGGTLSVLFQAQGPSCLSGTQLLLYKGEFVGSPGGAVSKHSWNASLCAACGPGLMASVTGDKVTHKQLQM